MGTAAAEANQVSVDECRTSSLRSPVTLRRGHLRLSIEPEGSVRFLESLKERRLLFGREQLLFCKFKAGILLRAQQPDWRVSLTPFEAAYSARVLESVDVAQRLRLSLDPSEGYIRRVTMKNGGPAAVRLRVLTVHDPTAANFREGHRRWGSLAVNAFNRSSHVAMDEVAGVPAARLIGAQPEPKVFYLTTDRAKASALLAAGELPEATAGTSGQVVVLAQYDFELPAASAVELSLFSLYDPEKLESAISSFGRLSKSQDVAWRPQLEVACSSPDIATAASWAVSALEGVQYENDQLDRCEVLKALAFVDPSSAGSIIERSRDALARDGSARHASDPAKPGILESSTLLEGIAISGLASDKKYARSLMPTVRRLAGYLLVSSKDGRVRPDPSLPQGWRRKMGKGCPTGEIPELSLAVAAALSAASALASRLGKTTDSESWRERSAVVFDALKKVALDEGGSLALCVEGERQRQEETVDQAVACYRFPLGPAAISHVVRRLLEKDFETGWGPRTVPTSNRIYFNPAYGEGQLGGYWTRAALAHATAAYRAGLGSIGSAELESVSKLVMRDSIRMGGIPGEFPYWVDTQKREKHGVGSDPVAASRFLEAVIVGELGLAVAPSNISFSPSSTSRLKWLLLSGLNLGRRTCVFMGRGAEAAYAFVGLPECRVERGSSFSGTQPAQADDGRVSAVSFYLPGQTICAGNSSESPVRTKVSFKPRDPSLAKHLSATLEGLDQSSGSWNRLSAIRILSTCTFEVALAPGEWGAFRVSTGS